MCRSPTGKNYQDINRKTWPVQPCKEKDVRKGGPGNKPTSDLGHGVGRLMDTVWQVHDGDKWLVIYSPNTKK